MPVTRRHWCETCHGHTGPGSPCAPDPEPEEDTPLDSAQAAALWHQEDARYLYGQAAYYRDTLHNTYMARIVQDNAANSARLAREAVDRMEDES